MNYQVGKFALTLDNKPATLSRLRRCIDRCTFRKEDLEKQGERKVQV